MFLLMVSISLPVAIPSLPHKITPYGVQSVLRDCWSANIPAHSYIRPLKQHSLDLLINSIFILLRIYILVAKLFIDFPVELFRRAFLFLTLGKGENDFIDIWGQSIKHKLRNWTSRWRPEQLVNFIRRISIRKVLQFLWWGDKSFEHKKPTQWTYLNIIVEWTQFKWT